MTTFEIFAATWMVTGAVVYLSNMRERYKASTELAAESPLSAISPALTGLVVALGLTLGFAFVVFTWPWNLYCRAKRGGKA